MLNAGTPRQDTRFPAVGIGLLYSPFSDECLPGMGAAFAEASSVDISVGGLAFDVNRSLDVGQDLVIEVANPDSVPAERLLAEVRWCRPVSRHHFRVGARVRAADSLGDYALDNAEVESIDHGPAVPSEAAFRCPCCEKQSRFTFLGLQKVSWAQGLLPLYTCSACGTTRGIPNLIAFNRECLERD